MLLCLGVTAGLIGCVRAGTSGTPAASPAPAAADSDGEAAGSARRAAADLQNRLNLPSLSVAVWAEGRLAVEERWGWADVDQKVPLTSSSLYRIGSVSKLLTTAATLRLRERGALDLDAPIGTYLADLPADKAALTARQLAGHLAGVRHYGRDNYINTTTYQDVAASLGNILAAPLIAEPGSRYAYSSYGFNVLGAVLQSAGRAEFRTIIRNEVTGPLGMDDTLAEESAHPPASRVHLYARDAEGRLVDAADGDLTDRWPSGGFLSTAADLARLAAGMVRPGFLSEKSRALLLVSQKTSDGAETNVSLGWRIGRDEDGVTFLHHGGETLGGRAFLLVYPGQGVAVALLTNVSFAPFAEKEALSIARPFVH